MKREERTRLFRRLAYIAENFDQNDPEDAEMWTEYKEIKKQLGIPNYGRTSK